MHPDIKKEASGIARAFNQKQKNGIAIIKEIFDKNDLDLESEIAIFLYEKRNNLNLKELGADVNKTILNHFVQLVDLSNLSFSDGIRKFLSCFKLPGEAQKIDRLMQAFGQRYCTQNPNGEIKQPDAAYILDFQVIMLNTDLHNTSIKHKMTLDQLKRNLNGVNQGENFSDVLLAHICQEIKANRFKSKPI